MQGFRNEFSPVEESDEDKEAWKETVRTSACFLFLCPKCGYCRRESGDTAAYFSSGHLASRCAETPTDALPLYYCYCVLFPYLC